MPRPPVRRSPRSFFHWLLIASLTFGAVGIAPLLLYILFGPADGNPIGLGLLFVFTAPFAILGSGIALIGLWWRQRGTGED